MESLQGNSLSELLADAAAEEAHKQVVPNAKPRTSLATLRADPCFKETMQPMSRATKVGSKRAGLRKHPTRRNVSCSPSLRSADPSITGALAAG